MLICNMGRLSPNLLRAYYITYCTIQRLTTKSMQWISVCFCHFFSCYCYLSRVTWVRTSHSAFCSCMNNHVLGWSAILLIIKEFMYLWNLWGSVKLITLSCLLQNLLCSWTMWDHLIYGCLHFKQLVLVDRYLTTDQLSN